MPSPLLSGCRACGATFKVKDPGLLGHQVRCPRCQQPMIVEALDEQEPSEFRLAPEEPPLATAEQVQRPLPGLKRPSSKPATRKGFNKRRIITLALIAVGTLAVLAQGVALLAFLFLGANEVRQPPVADYTIKQAKSLQELRSERPTRLLTSGPAPQEYSEGFALGFPVPYASEGHLLHGTILLPSGSGPHPAVVYCHGGFALGDADIRDADVLRKAGFAVFVPSWRGENGNPGVFELYYGEATDAVNAMEYLAGRSDIDSGSIFIVGHSTGAVIAMLAAELSTRPRGAVAIGGMLDMHTYHREQKERIFEEIPFIWNQEKETLLRSPALFLADLSCPLALYYGEHEFPASAAQAKAIAEAAPHHNKQVTFEQFPGTDHLTSLTPALTRSATFFRSLLDTTEPRPASPAGGGGHHYLTSRFDRLPAAELTTWPGRFEERERDWNVAPDPRPADDLTKLYELSQQARLKNMSIAGPQRWWMVDFSADEASVVHDLFRRRSHRILGPRPRHANAALDGLSRFAGVSPNGRMLVWQVEASNDPAAPPDHWIALHRTSDLGLVRVIQPAATCQFVADDRVLVSRPLARASQQEFAKAEREHRVAHGLRLVDLRTGAESPEILVREGGIWELSPGKKWLVVSQPDEDTAARLRESDAGAYDSLPALAELSVYDTVAGKLASHSVFRGVASGHIMRFSDDGRELAVLTGNSIGIWDFATGTAVASSKVSAAGPTSYLTLHWLDDGKWLLINGNLLLHRPDGRRMGALHRNEQRFSYIEWVGNRYRADFGAPFVEFPFDQLATEIARADDPASNLLTSNEVELAELAVHPDIPESELQLLRDHIHVALQKRLGLKVVESGNGERIQARVRYSERRVPAPNLENQWYAGLTKVPHNTPALKLLPEPRTVNCTLTIELTTPDGRIVWEQTVKGSQAPEFIDASVPMDSQFREISLRDACAKLDADLPHYVPRDPELSMLPRPIPMPLNLPVGAALTLPETSRAVDSSWLASDHGLPAIAVHLAIHNIHADGKRASSYKLWFPTVNGQPTLVYHGTTGRCLVQPAEAESTAAEIDLGRLKTIISSSGVMASVDQGKLILRRIDGGFEAAQPHSVEFPGGLGSFVFSPSGRLVAVVRPQDRVCVYDVEQLFTSHTADNVPPLVELAEAGRPDQLLISGNEQFLVANNLNVGLKVWNLSSGALVFQHQPPRTRAPFTDARTAAITHDGSRLFAILGDELVEFDIASGKELERKTSEHMVMLSMAPDGKKLAVGMSTLVLQLLSLGEDRSPKYLRLDTPVHVGTRSSEIDLAWSADGSLLAASSDSEQVITVWQAP